MSGKYCFIVSTLLSAARTTKTNEMQLASHSQAPSQVASFLVLGAPDVSAGTELVAAGRIGVRCHLGPCVCMYLR